MKKIFAMAVLVIASVTILKGQNLHFGAVTGLNIADLSNLPPLPANATAIPKANMILGYHFGAMADYRINNHFFLDASLLYTTCGTKLTADIPATSSTNTYYSYTSTAFTTANTYNLAYLQLPLMAKYKFSNGINIFAGPYIGYLMSSKENLDAYSYTTSVTNNLIVPPFNFPVTYTNNVAASSKNIDTLTNKFDFGLALGAGYQMANGLGINLKYSLGLSTVYKAEKLSGDPSIPNEISDWGKNGVIAVSVNYLFGMKK